MNLDKIVSSKSVRTSSALSQASSCWSEVANEAQERCDYVADEPQDRRQWTLKGIPPGAVDQTREAAKRSGMKLNAWVTQALYKAVEGAQMDDDAKGSSAKTDNERIEDLEVYIKESLVDLRRRTEEIESSMKAINAFLVRMYTER